MNTEVTPVAQPHRKVPIHLEDKVEAKLDEMLKQGIIEEVNEPCRWISPMVVVPKADGSIRICIDMRQANKAIARENHPLQTLDDIWPKLANATVFSCLDIKDAFHQVELTPESRYITTFITKRGLLRYTRLMFGINSAPEKFQKTIDRVLLGCKGFVVYLDDILVFGNSKTDHDQNLKQVVDRLSKYNVLLNKSKQTIGAKTVKFVGHEITPGSVKPCIDKLEAVKKFRRPESPEETRSFLGLVTYIGRFIPNLATLADPLRLMIREPKAFKWEQRHDECFKQLKEKIVSSKSLGVEILLPL